jgi:hypothetical protein
MNNRCIRAAAFAAAFAAIGILPVLACVHSSKTGSSCGTSYFNGPNGSPPCENVTCSTMWVDCTGVLTDYYCETTDYNASCSVQVGTVWNTTDPYGKPEAYCVNWTSVSNQVAACCKVTYEWTGCR